MTNYTSLHLDDALSSLPPEYPDDLLKEIKKAREKKGQTVVVLDDDPTGTQTVHDVHVLTEWDKETLIKQFSKDEELFYILTNSRSRTTTDAIRLVKEIGRNLLMASQEAHREFIVISRSDSTLRGHFPAETDALQEVLNKKDAIKILIPAFIEGGRCTLNDIHYVLESDRLIPVSNTPFAADPSFGYQHANLRKYIEEKTKGKVPARDVVSFSLEELRMHKISQIIDKLKKCRSGQYCIVNAVSYRDLQVFALALIQSEKDVLLRTAASIVPVLAGQRKNAILSADIFREDADKPVLIVVGSYVPLTTRQLNELKGEKDLKWLELDVHRILKEDEGVLRDYILKMRDYLSSKKDLVIYTSRELISADTSSGNMYIGNKVAATMVALIRALAHRPRCIISKGGITSSDIATKALHVKNAIVLGEAEPGIPTWELGVESRFPGLKYVVFPGNVGDEYSLRKVYRKIKGKA